MLFNSVQFLIFFPAVTVLYFLLPHKFRWGLLLIASCVFYMAFIPAYILILAVTIVIDYFAGMWIAGSQGGKKTFFLVLSIVSTCTVLFIFKYYNFFIETFISIAGLFHWNYPVHALNIILPIGLSFHTFQSLSYVIEVYRGNQKVEKHFGIYALYVMFYPQLVAGPIERPQNLLHQFREEHYFDYQRVTDGLKLMVWGMFKKVVIADRISMCVKRVYGNPAGFDGLALIAATVFFAVQIYCDFSGYSDIAIGAAQVMGFRLMDNFNRPYYSKSISEFWKRWHISLSSWFRDYFYISLGGNRVPVWRWQFNLLFTFIISGLWHGANWTFIIWGALNGFYLVFAIWTRDIREKIAAAVGLVKFPKLRKYWQVAATFSLVCFAWIFFRAKNLATAWYIATHLTAGLGHIFSIQYLRETVYKLGMGETELLIDVVSILFMEFVHLTQRHNNIRHMLAEKPAWFRWTMYYATVIWIIVFGNFGYNSFIYFQF